MVNVPDPQLVNLSLEKIVGLGEKGLSLSTLRQESAKIGGFLRSFDERGQGFTFLPKLHGLVLAAKELAEKMKGRFKDIVVLGIGGSALGVRCLRDALKGPLWNLNGAPRLFILDNLDTVDDVELLLDLDKTLFIVISKSGETLETMTQYHYFKQKVSKENFVFITDPSKGELRALGKEYGIPMLDIPENVGGRFSVLSPVGMFPALLLDLPIEEILKGAEAMVRRFRSGEFEMNLPFQLATAQYLLEWKQGITMQVLMPYSSRLLSLADWYAQLLAESLGKQGKGLTPLKALGVTDQHSQLQLWSEGPRDKLILFLEVEQGDYSFHDLMNIEKHGTELALTEYGRPNLTLSVPKVNAYELGQLFMFFECSIAFLGEYYRINAFDQPGVERGKQLTQKLLHEMDR